jgi:N-acetylmuramoyl-L-alanine amidase
VVLDPGHGGDSPGARIGSAVAEKELTLDIALRLRELLAAAGFEVAMTREDDRAVSLEERAGVANRAGADLFVSIHVNWIENRDVRGVETYYLGSTDDPFVTRLAAAENVDSGYAQADLRELLASVYAGLRGDASRRAAAEIQRALLRSLRSVNPAIADRGVKTAPFLVLAETEMPAVLAEVSCLSNHEEAELLSRPLYRQYIAEALAAGIVRFAEGRRPPAGQPAAAGRGA